MVAALARTITNRWASLLFILLGVSSELPRALRVKVLRYFWPCLARRYGVLWRRNSSRHPRIHRHQLNHQRLRSRCGRPSLYVDKGSWIENSAPQASH
ncbi:hypothetical protein A4X06_0g6407 [Tilletia controversa]|uniref:Uncharacterized protein n=2 Tax=Tilletia TaxID=13289 RepID=A0A8X7MNQ4_9BASI|nr:hypothetical protein A4X06_0g6407 [Tilletia controversa]KAE8262609.1 hypothetical protein A4X03_0g2328 [Tilletia caries]